MNEKELFSGFRLAHTMIRVLDLKKSLKFYCDTLGMKILRKTDYPEENLQTLSLAMDLKNNIPH